MCHKDHISRIVLEEILHLPLEHILQVTVQCGKRLIQKNGFRLSDHHSGQCHSLLLSPGKLRRQALLQSFQMISPDQICHLLPGGGFFPTVTAADVLFHCHGWEQRIILKQIADPTLLGLQIDPCFRIEDCFSVDNYFSLIRRFDPCNTAQGHAFSASGSAKKPNGCRTAFKIYLQGKIPEVFFDIYFDCHQIHLLVFMPFPDTILISATITKEISTITMTQKPAVP